METKTVYCCHRVYYAGEFTSSGCTRRMKVERNGRPYCGWHDPEKVKAKRAALEAKWQAKSDEQKAIRDAATILTDKLGVGRPEYSFLSGNGRYTGSIVLSAEEAQRLIVRLERNR